VTEERSRMMSVCAWSGSCFGTRWSSKEQGHGENERVGTKKGEDTTT
jgi:hypothetical protein